MSEIAHKARLERLLQSGLCTSGNLRKHVRELKKLVERINDEDVRRRSYALKALADPVRIKILHLLKNRPMCTCEVMVALGLTEPNASHHLNLLERNGIVSSEKVGKWVFYKLNKPELQSLASTIAG